MVFGSSNNSYSFGGPPINPKTAEAELISRATTTAIVAARSILMAGGNEEIALKTAKAAAELILNTDDDDTVSGRSTFGAFGGKKRKARRQAEVVASMALMSATSLAAHHNNPHGKNIITTTFCHDEPSVLSGSISTAQTSKIPTNRSSTGASHADLFSPQGSGSISTSRPPKAPSSKNSTSHVDKLSPREYGIKNYGMLVSSNNNMMNNNTNNKLSQQKNQKQHQLNNLSSITPKELEKADGNVLSQRNANTVGQSSTMDLKQQSSADGSVRGAKSLDLSTDAESILPHNRNINDDVQNIKKKDDKEMTTSWTVVGVLLSPFTAAMNVLTCGQKLTALDNGAVTGELLNSLKKNHHKSSKYRNASSRQTKYSTSLSESHDMSFEEDDRDDACEDRTTDASYSYDDDNNKRDYNLEKDYHKSSKYRNSSSRQTKQSTSTSESHDLSFEEDDCNDTCEDCTTDASYSYDDDNNKRDYRDPDFGFLDSSYSDGSGFLKYYQTEGSEASEGNLLVRSLIREKMENIVSKSKRSYRQSKIKKNEKSWLSYESRNRDNSNNSDNRAMQVIYSPRNSPRHNLSPITSIKSPGQRPESFFKQYRSGRSRRR